MKNIRKLLSSKTGFKPKTQAQALAAMMEGVVNESYYIFKGVNIHPVFEEPWDLNETERLLAKDDLSIETTILLMMIFERLIHDKDKEKALFAAESINAVEQRFILRIQKLKKRIEIGPERELVRKLIAEYRNLGKICYARPVLKRFYLGEAKAAIEKFREIPGSSDIDTMTETEIFLELGETEKAENLVAKALALAPGNPAFRFLAAKADFAKRDYKKVIHHLEIAGADGQNPEIPELTSFWTGNSCHD